MPESGGMKSIRELYKIGKGPSSSHTIGPERAARRFRETHPDADAFQVRPQKFWNLNNVPRPCSAGFALRCMRPEGHIDLTGGAKTTGKRFSKQFPVLITSEARMGLV